MTLRDLLAIALIQNELGGRLDLAYRFSDADGVRSGKSGWSFGKAQFDLANNPQAALCLVECGFTHGEIEILKKQDASAAQMAYFNGLLQTHRCAAIIDHYDQLQLDECLNHTRKVISNAGLTLADDETFVHLADYHNQFYLNYGGKCVAYLQRLGRTVTPEDVRDYKLTTIWGQKCPGDVRRRYNNIHRLCERTAR